MAITNGYTTLTTLKRLLGGISDIVNDTDLERAIEAASREIDDHTDRHFYQLTEVRTFVPTSRFRTRLPAFNDLVSVNAISTDDGGDGTFETTWATSDFQLLTEDGTPNANSAPEPRPFVEVRAVGTQEFPIPFGGTRRLDLVQIDGVWGWPAIPTAVEQACLLLAEEIFKLKDAPFGVAGFGEFGTVRVRNNPKIAKMLSRYTPVAIV